MAVVWAWGTTAGLLFGTGRPAVGPGPLLGVLVHLPRHVADPARAWPAVDRARLPGPIGFYAALGLVLAAATAVGMLAVRLAGPWLRASGGARWARGRELRRLHGRSGSRLALGRHRGRLLHAERRHALVAFGPPQSGKSAGLAVPALLEWTGPAVASSIKTDLLAVTRARRQALGPTFIFDPFALSGGPSHTWSPRVSRRTRA